MEIQSTHRVHTCSTIVISQYCLYKLQQAASQVHVNEEFYIDWEKASVSTIRKDGTKSASKGDFAMKLTALVEAGSHTGYLALVKRRIDLVEKYWLPSPG